MEAKAPELGLAPETLAHILDHADLDAPYVSPVSEALVTRWSQAEVAAWLVGGMGLLSIGFGWWRRKITVEG